MIRFPGFQIVGLSICMIACVNDAFGQANDSIVSHPIPEVIVSATRTEKNADSIGRDVTVITREEINESGVKNLGELLSNYEGISVIGVNQNPGMTESLFMRGTSSNQTVILVDGIPMSDPSSTNNALDLTELPLSNIERVEIVRGSHSTLYGSAAIGGSINIITRKSTEEGFTGDGYILAGTYGPNTFQLDENVFLGYALKNGLYANVSLFNTNVNGLDATIDTITSNDYKSFDDDGFNQQRGSVKVGFDNDKWSLFGAYTYLHQDADFDKGAYKYQDFSFSNAWYDGDSTRIFTQRHLINYQVSYTPSTAWNIQLSGGYTALERTTVDDSSFLASYNSFDHSYSDGQYEGSEMNHDLVITRAGKHAILTAGGGWKYETMNSLAHYYNSAFQLEIVNDLDSLDLNASLFNVFAQLDLKGDLVSSGLSPFNLILGARYNYHDLFGSTVVYEINPSFRLGAAGILYACYSTGFKAPSLYQLYAPDIYYTSDITRGNPDLKPEYSQSLEGGFKLFPGKKFRLGITVFSSTVENTIEYVYLWDKNVPIDQLGSDYSRDDFRGDTYLNVGKQLSWGAEFNFNLALSEDFLLDGNLTLVKGRLEYSPNEIDTNHIEGNHVQIYNTGAFPTTEVQTEGLVRRPSTANFGVTFIPIERGTIRLGGKWVGTYDDVFYDSELGPYGALNTETLDDYFLLDLIIRYTISKNFDAAVEVENVLNTDYVEIRGFATRGRGYYLKAGFRF